VTRPAALKLPRLSGGEAAARTALSALASGLDTDDMAGGLRFSLIPVSFATGGNADFTRRFRWSGAQFALTGTKTLEKHLAAHAFDCGASIEYAPVLREVALERFLGELTRRLGMLGRGAPELVDDAPASELRFTYRWQAWPMAEGAAVDAGCPSSMRGELHCDSLGQLIAGGLVTAFAKARNLPASLSSNDLRVRMNLHIGHATLPFDSLRSLREADVVLLEACALRERLITLSIGPSHSWLARLDNQRLIILEGPSKIMNLAQNAAASPLDSDEAPLEDFGSFDMENVEPTSLESLPVTLTFDIGQRQMTVAEAFKLSAGTVLDLGRPVGRAVHIRSGGVRIGEGELVEIDGRVGVSIVRLVSSVEPS